MPTPRAAASLLRMFAAAGLLATLATLPARASTPVVSPNVCLRAMPSTGWCGDGGPAVRARLGSPGSIVPTVGGGFAFVDRRNDAVRTVDPSGVIRTLVRIGDEDAPCDLGQLASTSDGSMLVTSPECAKVFRVSPDGRTELVAGRGDASATHTHDSGDAKTVALHRPEGVAQGPDGSIYVADDGALRRIDAGGRLTTVNLRWPVASGSLAFGRHGVLYINSGRQIWRLGPGGKPLTPLTSANAFGLAVGVTPLPDGRVLIPDFNRNRIVQVSPSGHRSVFAGTGVRGLRGRTAASARFSEPNGVAAMPDGSVLVSDAGSDRVRRIASDTVVTTIAGSGTPSGFGAALSLPADFNPCVFWECRRARYAPLLNHFVWEAPALRGEAGRWLRARISSSRRVDLHCVVRRSDDPPRRYVFRDAPPGRLRIALRRNWRPGRYRITVVAMVRSLPGVALRTLEATATVR